MNTNKIALITGGSRGLGKDMAFRLAEKQIDVIVTYHTKEQEANNVVAAIEKQGGKAAALRLNVEETKSFDRFFEELSAVLRDKFDTNHFDYLINNAGIGIHKMFTDSVLVFYFLFLM